MFEGTEIHKFGGSCLRDASDLESIACIVEEAEGQVVLVVSALWGTTDRLMRAAQEPRYAGRLVNDLASHHLRFVPTLIDSPLYDTFQRVLDGIEDSLAALASGERLVPGSDLMRLGQPHLAFRAVRASNTLLAE